MEGKDQSGKFKNVGLTVMYNRGFAEMERWKCEVRTGDKVKVPGHLSPTLKNKTWKMISENE